MALKHSRVEMINGPIIPRILIFTIPIILTSLLQLAYNAADLIVLGQFENEQALAAVGSTSSLNALIIHVFLGLSVGANVVVARYFGEKNKDGLTKTIHTSVSVSVIGGAVIMIFCLFLCRSFLEMMNTPDDIIDMSELYMKYYSIGLPASMLYNFGSAILRGIGETKKPLLFLGLSGIVNVGLNLIFVIVFRMSVAGVALATTISQYVSAIMVLIYLIRIDDDSCKISLKKLHIWKDELIKITKYGVPAGIQTSLFSLANVIIQSQVNSFSSVVVAGNTASNNIESFLYVMMNAYFVASMTFTSQNIGAGRFDRLKKIFYSCLLLVFITGVISSGIVLLFRTQLLGIYLPNNPASVEAGTIRLTIFCCTYFLNGVLDVIVGTIRGMGRSVAPTLISLVGICGVRLLWVFTAFALNRSLYMLYITYPLSWLVTAIAQFILYLAIRKKVYDKIKPTENRE